MDRYGPNPYLETMGLVVSESVWRASKKELEDTGAWYDDALRLERGGYVAITGVHHEIHCLDWIKNGWSKYKDDTPPLAEHIEHTGQSSIPRFHTFSNIQAL
jgi:hypothetical protein